MKNMLLTFFLIPLFAYSDVIFEDDFEGPQQDWASAIKTNKSLIRPKPAHFFH